MRLCGMSRVLALWVLDRVRGDGERSTMREMRRLSGSTLKSRLDRSVQMVEGANPQLDALSVGNESILHGSTCDT